MMHAIVTTALIGTAQQPRIDTRTGTSLDTLIENLAESDAEQKLLLSAGAWAIYQQAGQIAETLPPIPEPAAPERLTACSQKAASLLGRLFQGEHRDLLPEVLEHMQQAGQRLPHELLPIALDTQSKELRLMLLPVLGERGYWLSQFNTHWSWATHSLYEIEDRPADMEVLWQEGTLEQRSAILRLLRKTDAVKARNWLEAVWKQEKAEARIELLGTLEVGLSVQDEPFLEKALDDRAASVRAAASSLLAHIPTSAFALRMQARADTMLSFSTGALIVTPPTEIDNAWQRDGIIANPPSGVGERNYWFAQVLSLVPPRHWEERFATTTDDLIDAAYLDDEWSEVLIESWSKAAMLHKSIEWIAALWDWWCERQRGTSAWGVRTALLACMPPKAAERRVLKILTDLKHPGRKDWGQALAALPRPWSKEFGDRYLQELQHYVSSLVIDRQSTPYHDSWYQSLSIAAVALPAECFTQVLERMTIPAISETMSRHTQMQLEQWHRELKKFEEALRIRQRLVEEIAS